MDLSVLGRAASAVPHARGNRNLKIKRSRKHHTSVRQSSRSVCRPLSRTPLQLSKNPGLHNGVAVCPPMEGARSPRSRPNQAEPVLRTTLVYPGPVLLCRTSGDYTTTSGKKRTKTVDAMGATRLPASFRTFLRQGYPFTYVRERTLARSCHCEECNDEAISSGRAWKIATGWRPRNDMIRKPPPPHS
jgi:hypothetical protein